jgi:hypothetical protein
LLAVAGVAVWSRPTRSQNIAAFVLVLLLASSQAAWMLSYGMQTAASLSSVADQLEKAESDGRLMIIRDHLFEDPRGGGKKLGDVYNTRLKTLNYSLDRIYYFERIDSREPHTGLGTGYLGYLGTDDGIYDIEALNEVDSEVENILLLGQPQALDVISAYVPAEYREIFCSAEVRLFRK